MKALDTTYKGFRFRSRLEARWAVFMDTLGVRFEYEREAYELDGLCYLPDFWLPDNGFHLEIKPQNPNLEEEEKAYRLAYHTKLPVFILVGQPECPDIERNWYQTESQALLYLTLEKGQRGFDTHHLWVEDCAKCKRFGFSFDGRWISSCGCNPITSCERYAFATPSLVSAYAKARGYRFEPNGENFP